ncbi:uncharacterized protein LOC100176057 isoform X1 [Ciona intestinalis]
MNRSGCFLLYIALGIVLSEFALAQDTTSCPYHLCTAERLGCSEGGLRRDERGCLLCKCQYSVVHNRPCPLHGCTVELLGCPGRSLRKSNGCTLCECEPENATSAIESELNPTVAPMFDQASSDSQVCPQLTCTAQQLGCNRLAVNQTTRCRICACRGSPRRGNADERIDIDPNSDDQCNTPNLGIASIGRNILSRGSNVPKYKLAIRKLKKGFQPGKSYKVQIKAKSRAPPFKRFMVEIRKRPTARNGVAVATSCGSGHFPSNSTVPVNADCPLVAYESSDTNKTSVSLKWTAPSCGCIEIRAVVVDFHNVGYRDVEGERSSGVAGGKVPLMRTVCAKERRSSSVGKNKKRKKSKRKKAWVDVDCCRAANAPPTHRRQGSINDECEMRGKVYSLKKYYKLPHAQKSCRKGYKRCCIKNVKQRMRAHRNKGRSMRRQRI